MNLNEDVYVRLTPAGKDIAKKNGYSYTEDKNGWSHWQLWIFMQAFGSHLYMGNKDTYFEGNEVSFTKPDITDAHR